MPAVNIDASVVDGSNTRITPNPTYPVQAPVTVPAELAGVVDSPIDISEESAATLSIPNTVTPIAVNPELPPFALNHARIMYDSVLGSATVSANVGINERFPLIPNTAQRWTFTATTSNEITFALPTNRDIDTVCIGAHNLVNATVSVSYNSFIGGFIEFAPDAVTVNDNAIMVHISSSVSVKQLKITITGITGSFYVGSIYAGVALQMQRPFFGGHTPAVLARQADYYGSMSESGNFIGVEVRRRALESDASWKNLTDTWYRQYFVPFLASAEILPFYFAWNLKQYPTDVAYCKNITNIAPSYSGQRNLMTVGIPLVGIA